MTAQDYVCCGTSLDCACCGLAIDIGALLREDDEHTCPGCGAVNIVFLDDDDPSWSEPSAHFNLRRCRHDIDGDEQCDACEAETERP